MASIEFKDILTPAQKQKLEFIYADYDKFKQDLDLVFKGASRDAKNIYMDDIFELAQNVDIRIPSKVSSHRKILGPIVILIKKFLMRSAKPVINVCLKRQLVVNDHVLNVAQKVAVLEERLRRLEEKLDKHSHPHA